jgi:hypothetical protein
MKTSEILSLLEKKEKKEFSQRLQNHTRSSLYALFLVLIENAEASKEKLFATFSKVKYRKDLDYLLRNELRLLLREVELFIVESEARNRFLNNDNKVKIWLLERMLFSGNLHEFELEWKVMMNRATQQANAYEIQQLLKIYSEYNVKHKEINGENISSSLQLLKSQNEITTLLFEEAKSEAEVKKSFLMANLKAIHSKPIVTIKNNFNIPQKQLKLIIEYNQLKAKTYSVYGEEKIDLLLKLSKMYTKVCKYRIFSLQELPNTYGNIGLEYFLKKEYNKAHEYYNKAIKASDTTSPNLGLLYNYSINAMMLEKYKIIQHVYLNYTDDINKNEKVKHRFKYFTAISLLFDNNTEKAFELLENDLSKRPVLEYYYYRVIYAMVYYQSGDYQLAEREITNILQSVRKNNVSAFEDKALVLLFQQLLQAVMNKESTSYKRKITVVAEKISALQKDGSNFSVILYKLLNKELDKLVVVT